MSILSDSDIQQFIVEKKISVEPFDPAKLTPNGYDLTIEEIAIPKIGKHIVEGKVKIPPMTWFAVSTEEYVKLSPEISAQLWIRTSYARRGIMSSFGKIDAGFEGNLTLSGFNASSDYVELEIGKTFAQMVFELLLTDATLPYEKRSGNYMRQRGVTIPKDGI
jgi:dCTP deaminase